MSRKQRVLRGGAVVSVSGNLRPTGRVRSEPEDRYWIYGFRVVIRRQQ